MELTLMPWSGPPDQGQRAVGGSLLLRAVHFLVTQCYLLLGLLLGGAITWKKNLWSTTGTSNICSVMSHSVEGRQDWPSGGRVDSVVGLAEVFSFLPSLAGGTVALLSVHMKMEAPILMRPDRPRSEV